MSRYIDADKLLTDEKTYTLPPKCGKASGNVVVFVDDIEKMPTADVVPKSEYDAVVSAVDNSTKEFLKLHDKYQEAKSEVAREIFTEIEKYLVTGTTYYGHCIYTMGVATFAELKKKYTEGTADEV